MANRKLTITFMHPGAPSVARLASLAGEGWLQVATDGWLNIVTPQLVEADTGAQFGRIRLRDINFLLIGSVFTDLADKLYTSPVGWAILPTMLTATFAALEATGAYLAAVTEYADACIIQNSVAQCARVL